jgi:CHAT domain-containing protein
MSRPTWRTIAGVALLAVASVAQAAPEGAACAGEDAQAALSRLESVLPEPTRALLDAQLALASCWSQRGQATEALKALDAAVHTVRRLHPQPDAETAEVLDRWATQLRVTGQPDAAIAAWNEALSIFSIVPDPQARARAATATRLARTLAERGTHGEALMWREKVLAWTLAMRPTGAAALALARSELANSLDDVGQPRRALNLRVMALQGVLPDRTVAPALKATLLHEAARSALTLRRTRQALAWQEQALAQARQTRSLNDTMLRVLEAQQAECWLAIGRPAAALAAWQKLGDELASAEGPDAPMLSGVYRLSAAAQVRLGQPEAARLLLQRALVVAQASGQSERLWRVQADMADLLAAEGQNGAAILAGKQAVDTVQTLRRGLSEASRALQASFLDDKRGVYLRLTDRLITAGRIDEAQDVLQMLKEQDQYEWSERGGSQDPRTTTVPFNEVEATALKRYEALRDQQLQWTREQADLDRLVRSGRATQAQRQRLDALRSQVWPQIHAAVSAFYAQVQRDAQAAATSSRAWPDLRRQQRRLQSAVNQLGQALPDARVVALQYIRVPGQPRLSIVLTAPGALPLVRQVRIDPTSLDERVVQAIELLRTPGSDPARLREALGDLHQWLIAPIEADLRQWGARTIMLSLNDSLRYLPFAALYNPRTQRYLAQDHATLLFNDAVDGYEPKPSPKLRLAAMGLTLPVDGLAALRHVPEELDAVLQAPQVSGHRYLDAAFSRPVLRNALADGSNVLHVASHFRFVPGASANSRLYLGDRSRLTVAELQSQDWRFDDAYLITLSACETGKGTGGFGQEVEGLGAVVLEQGAQAALVTLWRISDAHTPDLMRQFYANLSTQRKGAAWALQAVQAREAPRRHPYYWAPFVLMGNAF